MDIIKYYAHIALCAAIGATIITMIAGSLVYFYQGTVEPIPGVIAFCVSFVVLYSQIFILADKEG